MSPKPHQVCDEWSYPVGRGTIICVVRYSTSRPRVRLSVEARIMLGSLEMAKCQYSGKEVPGWKQDDVEEWMDSAVRRMQREASRFLVDVLNFKF